MSHSSPLQSLQQSCHAAQLRESLHPSDLRYWQVYLRIHLVIVICTAIATLFDTGYWSSNALHFAEAQADFITRVFGVAIIIGMIGAVYVSPLLILFLFIRAIREDRRYAVAGFTELLLTTMHFFAAIPQFQ